MRTIFLLAVVCTFTGCNSMQQTSKRTPTESSLYTILYTSENKGREEDSHEIITNKEDLTALYQSIEIPEVPQVDFAKSQVLVLYLGLKNTGGYRISIAKIEEQADKIIVYKKEEAPKGMATMAFTKPFTVALIHSTKKIVVQ